MAISPSSSAIRTLYVFMDYFQITPEKLWRERTDFFRLFRRGVVNGARAGRGKGFLACAQSPAKIHAARPNPHLAVQRRLPGAPPERIHAVPPRNTCCSATRRW